MALSFVMFVVIITICFLSIYEKNRLQKQNIKLKIKLSDLAIKSNCPEQAEYKIDCNEKQRLKELLNQNKKIEAIKLLKENHSMSLMEAKMYVEGL